MRRGPIQSVADSPQPGIGLESDGVRWGPVVSAVGKTRITIMLDDDVIEAFRARAESGGTGYRTLINATLREAILGAKEKPLTVTTLRRVLREELRTA